MMTKSKKSKQVKRPSSDYNYKRRMLMRVSLLILLLVGMVMYSLLLRWQINKNYNQAVVLFNEGLYEDARKSFDSFGNYEESFSYLSESLRHIKYDEGQNLLDNEEYLEAANIFRALGEFLDSKAKVNEALYGQGKFLYDNGNYEEAFKYFQDSNGYESSDLYIANITILLQEEMQKRIYNQALKLYKSKEYSSALAELSKIEDYADSAELIQKCNDAINQRKLATTISAGVQYSLAITSDGKVKTTGYNHDGQSNVSNWNNIVSISGLGVLTIGLKDDGTVVTAGKAEGDPVDTSQWKNIIAVSAGERYVVGLTKDGNVVGQGHKEDRQLNFSSWKDIIAIATGWRHTVGLDKDGKVYITGYGDKRQSEEIRKNADDWKDIVAIAAGGGGSGIGDGHTVGLKKDGTVVAVGDKTHQQCDVSGWTDIVAIAAGDWHTVGLRSDGTVVATGNDGTDTFDTYDNACAVGGWTDIVAIAAGSGYTLGLKSNGSVVYVGYNDSGKCRNTKDWNNILIYNAS